MSSSDFRNIFVNFNLRGGKIKNSLSIIAEYKLRYSKQIFSLNNHTYITHIMIQFESSVVKTIQKQPFSHHHLHYVSYIFVCEDITYIGSRINKRNLGEWEVFFPLTFA